MARKVLNSELRTTVKLACGLSLKKKDVNSWVKNNMDVYKKVAERVAQREGKYVRCKLCGLLGASPIGIYIHVIRKHKDEVVKMIAEELEKKNGNKVVPVLAGEGPRNLGW